MDVWSCGRREFGPVPLRQMGTVRLRGKESNAMATSVNSLAELVDGRVVGDGTILIHAGQSIGKAGPRQITFAEDAQNLKKLKTCRASAVVVSKEFVDSLPGDAAAAFLIVENAQQAFLQIMGHFCPPRPRRQTGISPQAVVDPSAKMGANTNVAPFAVIGADVVIGANGDICSGVSIGPGCRLGDNVTLHANVVLYHDVQLGNDVIIHASAVIGGPGFGYRMSNGRFERLPHFGSVRIGNDVEIGSCTTIDRAMIGETVVGDGTKLDNLVMVAHNCELGKHNAMAAFVGLAGSATTGDYVMCGGQAGIADHVHVTDHCRIATNAGVTHDLMEPGSYIGAPALPAAEAIKMVIAARTLPKMRTQLRELKSQVAELTACLESLTELPNRTEKTAA